MRAHDPQHGGQAQPAAGELGGEERVEYPRQVASSMPQPVSWTSRVMYRPGFSSSPAHDMVAM